MLICSSTGFVLLFFNVAHPTLLVGFASDLLY